MHATFIFLCRRPAPFLNCIAVAYTVHVEEVLNMLTSFFLFFFSKTIHAFCTVVTIPDCTQSLNVCGANLCICWMSWRDAEAVWVPARRALPGVCNFLGLPTVALPGWLLFFFFFFPCSIFGSQPADTIFFFCLFVCFFVCFLPGRFPRLDLLAGK